MGDVALTLPVLKSVLQDHPDLQITLVTRRAFLPIFENIDRLEVIPAEFSGEHRGLTGLLRLYRALLKKHSWDGVIDLHEVLRTRILNFFFRFAGIPVHQIHKGRNEKRRLIKGKLNRPLTSMLERYLTVFADAGYPAAAIAPPPALVYPQREATDETGIAIAPCARHPLKAWPPEKMIALMQILRKYHQVQFYLFGGRDELEQLQRIAEAVPGTSLRPAQIKLRKQLELMARMKLMITMDSANMHLAGLTSNRDLGRHTSVGRFYTSWKPGKGLCTNPTERAELQALHCIWKGCL